jgi:hypothetical protein
MPHCFNQLQFSLVTGYAHRCFPVYPCLKDRQKHIVVLHRKHPGTKVKGSIDSFSSCTWPCTHKITFVIHGSYEIQVGLLVPTFLTKKWDPTFGSKSWVLLSTFRPNISSQHPGRITKDQGVARGRRQQTTTPGVVLIIQYSPFDVR